MMKAPYLVIIIGYLGMAHWPVFVHIGVPRASRTCVLARQQTILGEPFQLGCGDPDKLLKANGKWLLWAINAFSTADTSLGMGCTWPFSSATQTHVGGQRFLGPTTLWCSGSRGCHIPSWCASMCRHLLKSISDLHAELSLFSSYIEPSTWIRRHHGNCLLCTCFDGGPALPALYASLNWHHNWNMLSKTCFPNETAAESETETRELCTCSSPAFDAGTQLTSICKCNWIILNPDCSGG